VAAVLISAVVVLCGMTLFTPRFGTLDRLPMKSAKPLGKRRKSLAFLVIAAGLLTFFLPLVTTNPPVVGRSRWSACSILWQIYEGNLPLKSENLLSSIPVMATVVYLLLVFGFVALCLSASRDGLAIIAIFGFFTTMFWRGDRNSFEELFYGRAIYHNLSLVRHVGFGDLTIVLLGTTGALLYIAVNEDLDTESSPRDN
jgi:hypothetical protein